MRRQDNFGLRVSDVERAMIGDLAERLQRSESDVIRLLVREAVKGLQVQDEAARTAATKGVRDAAQKAVGDASA